MPLLAETIALTSALAHFHLRRRLLRAVLLGLALWILIPGLDEVIVFPLLHSWNVPLEIVLPFYYGIGILALVGWWFFK